MRRIFALLLLTLIGSALLTFGCSSRQSGIPALTPLPAPNIPDKPPSVDSLMGRSGRPLGVLLMGSDKRPSIPGERSDALMYVLISGQKRKAFIISFPRDAYMMIPGKKRDRINAALTYGGPELSMKTVEGYLGLPVDYYVLADFSSFQRAVDRIGGVRLTLNSSLRDRLAEADLPAGTSTLNGQQALSLARARHSVPGGDFGRAANQQKIVLAATGRFIRQGSPARFSGYVSLMKAEFRTNMPVPVALNLARTLQKVPAANIETKVLSGRNGRAGRASVVLLNDSEARILAARAKRELGIRD